MFEIYMYIFKCIMLWSNKDSFQRLLKEFIHKQVPLEEVPSSQVWLGGQDVAEEGKFVWTIAGNQPLAKDLLWLRGTSLTSFLPFKWLQTLKNISFDPDFSKLVSEKYTDLFIKINIWQHVSLTKCSYFCETTEAVKMPTYYKISWLSNHTYEKKQYITISLLHMKTCRIYISHFTIFIMLMALNY